MAYATKSNKTQAKQNAQAKTQASLDKLESGIKQLGSDENWRRFLKTQSKFHSYSFRNTVLILCQCPEASRVAGYRAWQGMNRQVKKGERAISILAPWGRKMKDEETGSEVYNILGFKTVSVFDISQTEGEELPDIKTSLDGDDEGLFSRLEQFALHKGFKLEHQGSVNGAHGWCRYEHDGSITISVDPLMSPLHRAKTLAHEIGHAILHSAEEYRNHTSSSIRELEAESTAFVTLDYFGLNSSDYSFAYIASWNGTDEKATQSLKDSGSRIQKAAHEIIEWVLDKSIAQPSAITT